MNWDYRLEETAKRNLREIGPAGAVEILRFLDKRIKGCANPEQWGKPLGGSKHGLWRYRVRDYRIICRLEKSILIVIVIAVGHRSGVYDA